MISRQTITNRLNRIIAEAGMKPTEVAKKAGLKQSSMSNWCNGKTSISLIDYIKICDVCDTPNGFYDRLEVRSEIPGEVSSQSKELIDVLLEIHSLIEDKSDSPFDLFLENALYMRKVLTQKLKEDTIELNVAEESSDYGKKK